MAASSTRLQLPGLPHPRRHRLANPNVRGRSARAKAMVGVVEETAAEQNARHNAGQHSHQAGIVLLLLCTQLQPTPIPPRSMIYGSASTQTSSTPSANVSTTASTTRSEPSAPASQGHNEQLSDASQAAGQPWITSLGGGPARGNIGQGDSASTALWINTLVTGRGNRCGMVMGGCGLSVLSLTAGADSIRLLVVLVN